MAQGASLELMSHWYHSDLSPQATVMHLVSASPSPREAMENTKVFFPPVLAFQVPRASSTSVLV